MMRKSYADVVGPDDDVVGAGDNAVAEAELEGYYDCCSSDDCGVDGRAEDDASRTSAMMMQDAGESV
jgi:hypothetical protein